EGGAVPLLHRGVDRADHAVAAEPCDLAGDAFDVVVAGREQVVEPRHEPGVDRVHARLGGDERAGGRLADAAVDAVAQGTGADRGIEAVARRAAERRDERTVAEELAGVGHGVDVGEDRKSTRLNSSHVKISYAVFCLKKKTKKT